MNLFKIKKQNQKNKIKFSNVNNNIIVITEINQYEDIECEYLYNTLIGAITQIQ